MCSSIKRLTSKVLLVLSVWNVKPYTYLKRKKVRRTVRVELEPCVNKVTGPSPECSDFARVRFLARCARMTMKMVIFATQGRTPLSLSSTCSCSFSASRETDVIQ